MNERAGTRKAESVAERNAVIERFLKRNFGDNSNVLLLLATARVKPISTITFTEANGDAAVARKTFRRLSIPSAERTDPRNPDFIEFYFGPDSEHLERVHELFYRLPQDQSAHKELGTLLGFPATAVDANSTGEVIDKTDLPVDVKNSDAFKFYDRAVACKLSKEHWKDELLHMERWMNAAREIAPDYIDHLLSDDWENPGSGH